MTVSPRVVDPLLHAEKMNMIPYGPEGLLVHLDDVTRRLATPWQVCMIRARQLEECDLPDGMVIDPACGAGLQLAALSNVLGKEALGVDIDESRAGMAAANQQLISDFLGQQCNATIVAGDGTKAAEVLKLVSSENKYALFYFDPARPVGSTTHALDEMDPKLNIILDAWKPYLKHGETGPAMVLDLSPRLSFERREEVEDLVDERWPGLDRTWQWASRGSGRIDRLSLWLGAAADSEHGRRFIRIPPDHFSEPLELKSVAHSFEEPPVQKIFPRKGNHLTILDSALVSSGLASTWLDGVLENEDRVDWQVTAGRRPIVTHGEPLRFGHELDSLLIQCTGMVVSLVRATLDENNLESIAEKAIDCGFNKMTLRTSLPPEVQPVLQRGLDRMLRRSSGTKSGFITRTGADEHLLLCHEE